MQVNGVSIPLEKPQTLLEFLNEKGYNLHSDVIEIVSFMGGGAC